jgi:cyanophycin synthetase
VAVTGTNGKTSVSRLVAHLLSARHGKVGLACSDGLWIGGRLLDQADCGGPRSARRVLSHPEVEAAVFEAGRGGIVREGLGFDRCDVAVVTNIAEADHLGRASVETPEEMFTVKRCPVDVVPKTGASVLKADDPLVADMARLSDGAVVFFALDGAHPVVEAHRAAGGRALFVKDGRLVDGAGASETAFVALESIPAALEGRVPFIVENLLAASAAALSLGLSYDEVARGLATFPVDGNPGRFQRFDDRGVRVLTDDAHNVPALRALVEGLDGVGAQARTIVYSAGAHRRDEDVVRQGGMLAAAFDRVVVYEDPTASDRSEGELTALLRRGLAVGGRVREVVDIADQQLAIDTARRLVKPGEWLVVQTDDGSVVPTLATVRDLVGTAD